jgi:5-methylcytosine-specific restriction endonuclease McrA
MGSRGERTILEEVMPPSPENQIKFLVNLQRLLAEGLFVATYKYALLLALADLSVETGDDSGAALTISTPAIAEKFVAYYWRQSAPYAAGRDSRVLQQNTGKQAKVLKVLEEARARYGDSLAAVIQKPSFGTEVVRTIDEVVRVMPLWKLQTVGQERLDFLYPNASQGTAIELRPGVAYCFRQFHELISDLVRGAWLRNVRQQNLDLIGETTDLSEFLFGSERASLAAVRPPLEGLQQGKCFYCGLPLRSNATEVDHFISWSRYPADLGHNFVLADRNCNAKKRDRIPAYEHLCAWAERNEKYGGQLAGEFQRRGVVANLGASTRIAHWAYAQTEAASGVTWLRGEELVPLQHEWRKWLNG